MILIYGSKLYGRVDEVPGMFYVATRFGHIWYLPLIPMGSVMVLEASGKPMGMISVGFNFKSFALAWLRAGLLVAWASCFFVAASLGMDQRTGHKLDWVGPALIGAVFAGAWIFACYGKW